MSETTPARAGIGPMPVLFLGHGSPMNAVEDNVFTRSLAALGRDLPRPEAILVVSAHWQTRGTRLSCLPHPRTIHDFMGFPPSLYAMEYPAPGAPGLAREIAGLVGGKCDDAWGFDHASWAVLHHMYPHADVPLMELSLDATVSPAEHFDIGRRLAPLRDRGVLVIGSGNIVHNLRAVYWGDDREPYPWAVEFDEWVRDRLEAGDDEALVDYEQLGSVAALAVPTNEHYLPLLYASSLRREDDALAFTHTGIDLGSVSMRCVQFG
ncbi:MAG TPA: 4,5-DOPA dioxygenase extradiol [Coriobacteriia bacterium]